MAVEMRCDSRNKTPLPFFVLSPDLEWVLMDASDIPSSEQQEIVPVSHLAVLVGLGVSDLMQWARWG
jgi:hypothetical protein